MADDIDKFVLEYEVKTGNAESELEKLNKQVEKVTKTGKGKSDFGNKIGEGLGKATGKAKELAEGVQDVAGEVQGLSGDVGGLTEGVGALVTKARALGPVVAAIAVAFVGVKAAIDGVNASMRNLEGQSDLARKIGTGTLQVEMSERAMSRASGGKVRREETRQNLQSLADFSRAAYMDKEQTGRESQILKRMGIGVTESGTGMMRAPVDIQTDMSKSLAGMSKDQADTYGRLLGLSQAYTDALRNMAGKLSEVSGMTELQAERHIQAAESAKKLDASYGRIDAAFTRMGQTIGDYFMPIVESGAELLAGASEGIENNLNFVVRVLSTAGMALGSFASETVSSIEKIFSVKGMLNPAETAKSIKEGFEQAAQATIETWKSGINVATKEQQERSKAQNEASYKQQTLIEKNISDFGAAVAAFSNTVDEKQAWAAWAGEIGKASGLSAPASFSGISDKGTAGAVTQNQMAALDAVGGPTGAALTNGTSVPVSTEKMTEKYQAHISAASKKYGIPENIIKGIINVESKGNSSAVSDAGAVGLMQIMPSNNKNLGITNAFDPAQNIMGGAKLMAEYLKASNGDMGRALTMYHGGYKEEGWGAKTKAYPGKVLAAAGASAAPTTGTNLPPQWSARERDAQDKNPTNTYTFAGGRKRGGGGESRETMRLASVQEAVASYLHVPAAQVQTGAVNKGDLSWALSQMMTKVDNELMKANRGLDVPGLTPQQLNQRRAQAAELVRQREQLKSFGAPIVEKGREGGRERTLGDVRVDLVVNVNGSGNPQAVADEVARKAGIGIQEAVNSVMNGKKA